MVAMPAAMSCRARARSYTLIPERASGSVRFSICSPRNGEIT